VDTVGAPVVKFTKQKNKQKDKAEQSGPQDIVANADELSTD